MKKSNQPPQPQGVLQSITASQCTLARSLSRLAFLAGLWVLLAGAPSTEADQNPPGCTGSGLGILLFTSASDVHVGNTLSYSITVFNGTASGPVVCDATGIQAFIVTPDGVSHEIPLPETNQVSGQSEYIPNAVSYVVRAQDIQPDGTVDATASDTGTIHQNTVDSTGGGNQGVNTIVSQPCIQITAQCASGTGENGIITFAGIVTNCGNDVLYGVGITNTVNGTRVQVAYFSTLGTNQSATFSGSWAPASPCVPSSAVLTAYGTDSGTAYPTNVLSSTMLACADVLSPGLSVSETCPASPAAPGQLLAFSGSVTNTGNVTLTGIVVVNNQPVPNTQVFTVASLAPGAVANFTGSFLAPTNCSVSDTLVATGTSVCGTGVSASASSTCPIITTPQILVTAACSGAPVTPGGAVAYHGTVQNTGNIPLTNVVVYSQEPVANTAVFRTAVLAPGVATNFTGSYAVPAGACAVTTTLSGVGYGLCGLAPVTNAASTTCAVTTTPGISVSLACPPATASAGGLIAYSGTVQNTGNVVLNNVYVVNSQPYANAAVIGPITLPVGGSANFTTSFTAPANSCSVSSTVTATGRDNCTSLAVTNTATATCPLGTIPAIAVTQACSAVPAVPGGLLYYNGTVTNTGNVTLTNVIVLNNLSGPTPVIAINSLAPGAGMTFAGGYLAPTNCSSTSTATASGTSYCGATVTASAATTCPVNTTPVLNVTVSCPAGQPAPGAVLSYGGTVTNAGNITITNVVVVNNNHGTTPVFTVAALAPGAGASFTGSYLAPTNCSSTTILTASGESTCGADITNTAMATCAVNTTPKLAVTQNCPVSPVAPGALLVYSGTVTNTGNITVTNVVVVNSISGGIFTAASLAPGAGASFTGSFLAPTNCAVASTATATGTSVCGVPATASASSICPIATTPALAISMSCPVLPAVPGGLLTFGGLVSNTGNIMITNVVVMNNLIGSSPVYTLANLAPGAVAAFTGSYVAPTNCTSTSVSTVTGAGLCGSFVTASASATCTILTAPAISVTENCPNTAVPPGGILTYGGSVSNAGNFTLTNIIVTSDRPAANTTIYTVASLAPGASASFTGSYQVPLNCCVVFSTATATGQACSGVTVSDSFTRTCTVLTAPAIVVSKVCPGGLLIPGSLLSYGGSVSNAGNITLVNVSLADSEAPADSPLPGPIDLAPGQVVTYHGSYTVPPDFCGSDTVTASAQDVCTYLPVSDSVNSTCPITTSPAIAVTKSCPPAPTLRGGLYTCTGSVSNSGNVSLLGVYVTDDEPTNNTPVIGPISLAPGATARFTNSYVAPTCCCLIIDTVTAHGQGLCNASNVIATATTVCPLLTIPELALVETCPPAPIPMGSTFNFSGYVTNSGEVLLTNVVVYGPLGTNNPVVGPIALAPGQAQPYSGSYATVFNTSAVTITATGQETCGGTAATNTVTCAVITTPHIARAAGVNRISFPTANGGTYALQYKNKLSDSAWLPVQSVTGNGSVQTISDTPAPGQPTRFYRVMIIP